MSKLEIIIGGYTLPDQASLKETPLPNETTVRTLDGSLYTDYINIGRSWQVEPLPLCRDDYDALYAIYLDQYRNESYTTLQCDALGISTIVKLELSDRDIRWNGDQSEGLTITLREAYAIS